MRFPFLLALAIMTLLMSYGSLGADSLEQMGTGPKLEFPRPNPVTQMLPADRLLIEKASLRDQLLTSLNPGTDSNPVVDRLLSDYVTYHIVFLVLGGIALLLLVVVSGLLFRYFLVLPPVEGRWGFRKSAAMVLGLSSGLLSLGLALVVFANATTVLDPKPGFEGSVSGLRNPEPGSHAALLQQAYSSWVQSGVNEVPALIQESINERLSWQAPKAWISLGLLVFCCFLGWLTWRSLGQRFAISRMRWDLRSLGFLVVAVLSTMAIPLFLAMVIGNSQGALAPLALTLFFA